MDGVLIFLYIAYVAVSIVLLLACLRLWRFFKGGRFSKSWKINTATAIFFLSHSIVCLMGIFFVVEWIIIFHEVLQLITVVFFTYGVWTFYEEWAKLGK